jgi:hypothetical protein
VDVAGDDHRDVALLRPRRSNAPPETLVGGRDLILKLRTLRI